MNSSSITVSADGELDYHQQLSELDSLYRKSPNGAAVLGEGLRYVRVNDVLAECHGMAAEKLIGRSLLEFVAEVGPELSTRLKEAVEQHRAILNVELTIKSAANGRGLRHLLAHFYPLERNGRVYQGTGLVMVDITQRKIAEETLRLSEARYRDVVEHSIYGVCSVSANGFAHGANSAMLRIIGCTSQEELASVNFSRDVFRYSDQQAQLFATCREQGSL